MSTIRIKLNKASANGFLQLVGSSVEDIQEQIKTKKQASETMKHMAAMKTEFLRNTAIDSKLKLKKALLDEKLQLEMLTEAQQKYNLELIEVQKEYVQHCNLTSTIFNDFYFFQLQ